MEQFVEAPTTENNNSRFNLPDDESITQGSLENMARQLTDEPRLLHAVHSCHVIYLHTL